jgi:hypothetical protein
MMGLITGKLWAALAAAGAVLALLGAALLRGRKQGRKQVQDELQDAYNTTTKEIHHEKSSRPVDADDVLDSLHKYAKRGQRRGDS